MFSLWLDLRYAVRMMVRSPGTTVVLALTLALGIGASTAMFSVVHSVLLRPLPYERPDELVRVYIEVRDSEGVVERSPSGPEVFDLREACRSCASVGMWWRHEAPIGGGDHPVLVEAAFVTHTLLPTLGVKPLLGRWMDESEDQPGDRPVVLLGYDLWKRVFAGDPAVIGRKITFEGLPVTVIGVMPPGFDFSFDVRVDAWIALGRAWWKLPREQHSHHTVVRLKPGVSIEAFRDELRALSVRWGAHAGPEQHAITPSYPPGIPSHPMIARPLHADFVGSLSTTLWLLQGAALFVLLISIVNIANLLLARAESRTREVAVRHALGASRRRLVRQFVTESLLLGAVGGGLGILVAVWVVDGMTGLLPASVPRASEIALDATAVAFAVTCSVAAALLFGIAPILHARRTDLHGALKDGSPRMTGSGSRLRARRALVVAEIALAVVLVIGCTVMVRSFMRLQQVELGFRPDHLLTFQIRLPNIYSPREDVFWHRLQDRLRALPGVTGVTLLDALPPARPSVPDDISFPGRAKVPGETLAVDSRLFVGDDFIATLGARMVDGRELLPSDTTDAPPVLLVNEAFARQFFRGEDPVGRPVQIFSDRPGRPPIHHTIVGVVADMKQHGLDRPSGTEIYVPMWDFARVSTPPHGLPASYVAVRTEDDPGSSTTAVMRAIADLDPALPIAKLRTMDELMWEAVARPRFLTFLLSCFAGVALLLAAIGIYGVMAHTVAQRTHEIGLRVALGAPPARVRAMVLRQAGALVAVGVALGLGAAVALQLVLDASLRGLFYGAPLSQPLLLAGVAIAVALTALLATWLPVRRATRVQPTIALRSE